MGRFIRTLKNKIYRYMTSVWKNLFIDKLDDVDNKYSTIEMKPANVKWNTYIDSIKKTMKKS